MILSPLGIPLSRTLSDEKSRWFRFPLQMRTRLGGQPEYCFEPVNDSSTSTSRTLCSAESFTNRVRETPRAYEGYSPLCLTHLFTRPWKAITGKEYGSAQNTQLSMTLKDYEDGDSSDLKIHMLQSSSSSSSSRLRRLRPAGGLGAREARPEKRPISFINPCSSLPFLLPLIFLPPTSVVIHLGCQQYAERGVEPAFPLG